MTGLEKLHDLTAQVRDLGRRHAETSRSTLSPEMKRRKCRNIELQMQKLIGVIESDSMRSIVHGN
jgi:hypothetical protein